MPFFLSSVQQGDCITGPHFMMTLLMSEGAGDGLLPFPASVLSASELPLHTTADGKARMPEMQLSGRPELGCGLSTDLGATSGAHI